MISPSLSKFTRIIIQAQVRIEQSNGNQKFVNVHSANTQCVFIMERNTSMKCLNCNEINHASNAKYCFRCGEYLVSDNLDVSTPIIDTIIHNMVQVDGGTLIIRVPPIQGYVTEDEEIITHDFTVPSFQLGRYQVTQEEWEVVMGRNPSVHKGAKKPVEFIDLSDCQKFIKRLNIITGMNFRLPKETEWEFAARGGNNSRCFSFSGGNNLDEIAWYRNNAFKIGESGPDYGTHPVGQKQPNELGLYDMTGNVWEWCGDFYDNQRWPHHSDADGHELSPSYAIRGGGWNSSIRFCRLHCRIESSPTERRENLGFRLAL